MPATRKRPPMEMEEKEMEPGDVREGSDDMPMSKHSRKRGMRGAKKTKAPMDAESCSCGAGKGKKCSCDGGCGSYKKMDSALTPHEYLAACDMGIQDRSRQYIRSRLDAAERLDLKCGNGSISPGEKCTKGNAQQGPSRKTLTGAETGILSRQRIKREGYYGAPVGGDPFSRKSQAKRAAALNAGVGALAGGVAGALLTGNLKGAAIGAGIGGGYGAVGGAAGGVISAQVNRMTSRAANRSLQREKFEKPIAARYSRKRASMKASGASRRQIGEYDMRTAMTLARGYDRINARTRGRYGADAVWADGFTPQYDQLAI
jgi:hypothetical protein